MYKIFLVDEIIIREAIRDNIDWESHGFVFAGEGFDEIAAINRRYTARHTITDIKMPL